MITEVVVKERAVNTTQRTAVRKKAGVETPDEMTVVVVIEVVITSTQRPEVVVTAGIIT